MISNKHTYALINCIQKNLHVFSTKHTYALINCIQKIIHVFSNKHTYALIDCIQKIYSVLMCSDVTNESITDNAHAYVYI